MRCSFVAPTWFLMMMILLPNLIVLTESFAPLGSMAQRRLYVDQLKMPLSTSTTDSGVKPWLVSRLVLSTGGEGFEDTTGDEPSIEASSEESRPTFMGLEARDDFDGDTDQLEKGLLFIGPLILMGSIFLILLPFITDESVTFGINVISGPS